MNKKKNILKKTLTGIITIALVFAMLGGRLPINHKGCNQIGFAIDCPTTSLGHKP